MKTFITCLTITLLFCGYTQAEPAFEPEKNTTVMLTAEAAVFMSILKEGGNIPGIPSDRKGNLQSGMMCDPQTEPIFPFNAPLRGIFNDTPDTFYEYIVTKDTEDAPWRITSAGENTKGTRTELALPSEEVQNSANTELLRRKQEDKAVTPDNISVESREKGYNAEPLSQTGRPIRISAKNETHVRLFQKYLNERDFDNARFHARQFKDNKWAFKLIVENEEAFINSTIKEKETFQRLSRVHHLALAGKFTEARNLASQDENDNSRNSLLELVDQIEERQRGRQQSPPASPPEGVTQAGK